jgi:hypothetical protein
LDRCVENVCDGEPTCASTARLKHSGTHLEMSHD